MHYNYQGMAIAAAPAIPAITHKAVDKASMSNLVEQMKKMTAHIHDLQKQISADRPVQ
jgi:hypothetical protein